MDYTTTTTKRQSNCAARAESFTGYNDSHTLGSA